MKRQEIMGDALGGWGKVGEAGSECFGRVDVLAEYDSKRRSSPE